MSILEALAKDHRALEQMLTELTETASTERKKRMDVFSRLQALLMAHSRAEEEVVYRRLRKSSPDESKTLEAYEEHHVADVVTQELASALPGGAEWTAKIKVFEELLRHHIKEEETQLFALCEERFDAPTLDRMEEEFRMLKHERLEAFLGPLRRATPAFAGRAAVSAQALAGRYARRGELFVRRAFSEIRGPSRAATTPRAKRGRAGRAATETSGGPEHRH